MIIHTLTKLTEDNTRTLSAGGRTFWDCAYGFGKTMYNWGYAIGDAIGYAINNRRR